MARDYKMVKRRDKVEETRQRIAKATYELHSTIGPALTTISLIFRGKLCIGTSAPSSRFFAVA